jgi:hypothetical protein
VRPPFIRVTPDEIERYGAAGAVVLAHIRYRCESDGPGRVEIDGVRWWRVSRRDMGHEVGLTLKVVRKALQALGRVVVAKHFPPLEDQSLAYRAINDDNDDNRSDLPEAPQGQGRNGSDLPEALQGQDRAPQGQVPSPTGPGTEPHRASALPIETLETKREKGEARDGQTPDLRPPPSKQPANSEQPRPPYCPDHPGGTDEPGTVTTTQAVAPFAQRLDTHSGGPGTLRERLRQQIPPPPPRFCRRHMPDGADGPCGRCGDARHNFTEWRKLYGVAWDAVQRPLMGKATAKAVGYALMAEDLTARMREQDGQPAAAQHAQPADYVDAEVIDEAPRNLLPCHSCTAPAVENGLCGHHLATTRAEDQP